jgi:glycosyltransferase involved in cell wall biosynthesis
MARFFYFEPWIENDVVQFCWGDRHRHPASRYNQPNVRYHFIYRGHLPEPLGKIRQTAFFVWRGLNVFRSGRRFRIIMCYGATRSAVAGLLLKWSTGAKLVIEVPGDPRTAYLADSMRPCLADRLKHRLSHVWVRFLLRYVDRLKLLFPGQMDVFPEAAAVPQSVYADFTNVSVIQPSASDDQYVLFLGFPWYLKGVDVLIRAFNQVKDEFPCYRLKIVGHCPDRAPFEALRGDNNRIEFSKGVFHDEALQLLARCTCLVLPSRTEAMGRVLLEAMATRKPIIASRVGGIPHYIADDVNGLLFESENVGELATCLRRVLGDPGLRERLADRGFKHARENLDERAFARNYEELIRQTIA